jgi:signal peptide peptidase SppA
MSFRLSTAAKLLHRPHLITPLAAEYWSRRMLEIDARAFRKTGRMEAIARKLGLARPPAHAWDDDDAGEGAPAPTRPVAYAPMWMGEPDKQLDWGWSIKDGIAMMEISGPLVEHGGWGLCEFMHGYDTIAAAIAQADADPSVKAMLIRFDTPGGVVASGIYDLSAALQARGPDAKPLWAHCEMAASAGYWIASQFNRVLCPQAGLTGSIGVVMVHENHAAALEKFGVEITSIEAPEGGFKTDGAWWKAMSEEGRAGLQSDINELFAAFLATVEAGRGDKLTAEKARSLGAQVFPAIHSDKSRDAKALGLIDDVMSEQAAFDALKAEVSAAPPFTGIPAKAGATASQGATKPVADATPIKEPDMSLRAALTALAKAEGEDDETFKSKLKKLIEEDDEKEAAEGEEKEPGEGAEETEEEKEAKAKAAAAARKAAATSTAKKPDATTVLAILDLPEAKGREEQARKLAETPGMTAETAKGILAAGPKASRLAGVVTDPKISAAGGPKVTQEEDEDDRAWALAGYRPRKR